MQVECPYCQFGMTLKEPKPGKYRPACRKCKRYFSLVIPTDSKAHPIVEQIDAANSATTPNIFEPPPVERSKPAQRPPEEPTVIQSPENSAANYDETMPSAAFAGAPEPAKSATASDTLGGIEATMPTAVTGASLKAGVSQSEADFSLIKKHGASASVAEQTMPTRARQDTSAGESSAASSATASSAGAIPLKLGGYSIIKELGRGAMGAVYLAKQLSLNRLVALKTVQAKWLDRPVILARFTREAYAAAQLVHHNVVQVYDLGNEKGTTFFSMEYVRGQSLADLVKQHGRLDPEVAASYILQAARGLQFAHNQGMVHRDVKPGNLMINEENIVKVADLGLVKVPQAEDLIGDESDGKGDLAGAAHLTMANYALGTAAFMAPEQAANSSGVDHRADIYSLGCSLYVLLTGKPPFRGASALEVISKHKTEPIVRPEAIVDRVPQELSEIVMRMVAKRPEDRYADMGAVIEALEHYLGLQAHKTFSPSAEHAQALQASVAMFNQTKTAKVRSLALIGFTLAMLVLAGLMLLLSAPLALGLFVTVPLTLLFYFVLNGVREHSILFDKTREFIFASRWTDWLAWMGGGLLALILILLLAGPLVGIGAIAASAAFACIFHFAFDRRVRSEQAPALQQTHELLRSLRLQGVDELALRQFVAKYSGENWEGCFEEMFGYEAKLQARELLRQGQASHGRRKFKPGRDLLIGRMQARLEKIRQAKQQRHLQKVEQAGLRAQGVSPEEARAQAEVIAQSIIQQAEQQRDSILKQATQRAATVDPAAAAEAKRQRIKAMLAEARSGKSLKKRTLLDVINGPLSMAAGGHVRFLLGCVLLIGCLLWMQKNDLLSAAKWSKAKQAIQSGEISEAAESVGVADQPIAPLKIPLIGVFLSSLSAGIAGLLLILSSFFRGWKMSIFMFPAAAVMVLGPVFLQSYANPLIVSTASIAIGLVLAFAGYVLGRTDYFEE